MLLYRAHLTAQVWPWLFCQAPSTQPAPAASKVSGWPKRCKLARAFLWEYSYKRLKLAQLLGQLGVFLTLVMNPLGMS